MYGAVKHRTGRMHDFVATLALYCGKLFIDAASEAEMDTAFLLQYACFHTEQVVALGLFILGSRRLSRNSRTLR